ncbi:hypothetical protein, partial [Pseudoxanthomonas sacheonensis]
GAYSDYVYVGSPTAAGSYKVQATATGIATGTSAVQTVSAPTLRIFNANNQTTAVAGKGMRSYPYEVRVQRIANGQAFNGASPLVVNLTSNDPSKLTVPETVTIPANESEVIFPITGVDLTSGTPVTVDASAEGATSPVTKLTVSVVAPIATIESLDGNRAIGNARDNFRVRLYVPGTVYQGNETAATNLPFDLARVEASPADIVDGFYSALTGGSAITQVVVPARGDYGGAYSDYVYVGSPTAAGSYKVQATATGIATGTSTVQTVSAPALRILNANGQPKVIVGKGMNSYVNEVYVERTANGQAFNGVLPLVVNLTCSSTAVCSVPATVTIPANTSSSYFYVSGVGLGTTTVTSTATGYLPSPDVPVTTVLAELLFNGLSASTKAGMNDNFSVYPRVPGAVYAGNETVSSSLVVNLTSSAPGVATVHAATPIAAGDRFSALVNLTGVAPGTTTVTASSSETQSATSGTITITP